MGGWWRERRGHAFPSWQCEPRPDRLRVGLVSGDLRNHPVGYFLESMLPQIDPSRIELIAYPTDHKADELTARIKPYFSAWKSLVGQSDEAAAAVDPWRRHTRVAGLFRPYGQKQTARVRLEAGPGAGQLAGLFCHHRGGGDGLPPGRPACDAVGGSRDISRKTVWRLPETYLCFTPPDVPLEVGPLPALSSGLRHLWLLQQPHQDERCRRGRVGPGTQGRTLVHACFSRPNN